MKKILLLLVPILLFSYFIDTPGYVSFTAKGYKFKGLLADTLNIPTGTVDPTNQVNLAYEHSAIYFNSTKGRFWIYNPHTDKWILQIASPVRAKTTSDHTTTSTTAADVPEMSVAVDSNTTYRVTVVLYTGCDNSGGIKVGLNAPSGASNISGQWCGSNANNTTPILQKLGSLGTVNSTAFNQYNGQTGSCTFIGWIKIGATSGNITVVFASAVNGQTSTVANKSCIDITEEQ